eukprot:7425360-Alexandrium_andersonii.AAC.1
MQKCLQVAERTPSASSSADGSGPAARKKASPGLNCWWRMIGLLGSTRPAGTRRPKLDASALLRRCKRDVLSWLRARAHPDDEKAFE